MSKNLMGLPRSQAVSLQGCGRVRPQRPQPIEQAFTKVAIKVSEKI